MSEHTQPSRADVKSAESSEQPKQTEQRGLYVCEECDAAFDADVNGAENIRRDLNRNNSGSPPVLDGDRSTGWLA